MEGVKVQMIVDLDCNDESTGVQIAMMSQSHSGQGDGCECDAKESCMHCLEVHWRSCDQLECLHRLL